MHLESEGLDLMRRVDAIEAEAWIDMIAAVPSPLAAGLGLRAERASGATLLLAKALPVTQFNRVIGLGVERPATQEDLDAVLATYRGAGVRDFWVHLSPAAEPGDLAHWLAARGLDLPRRRSWAKVARGTESPPMIDTPLIVREVGPAQASVLARVVATAHQMPPVITPWIEALVGRPGWRSYLALDGEEPVAAAFLYLGHSGAWLGLGGTLPSHRGRGGQGALMVQRIRDAIAAGHDLIATETGEPIGDERNHSLSNMYRCGFRLACSRLNYGPISEIRS